MALIIAMYSLMTDKFHAVNKTPIITYSRVPTILSALIITSNVSYFVQLVMVTRHSIRFIDLQA